MPSRKRSFRAPFVVTTAAIAVACGGSTFEQGPGSGGSGNGGGSSGAGASGGKSGSGTGGVGGATGGVGGSIGGTSGVGGDGVGGIGGTGGAYGSGGTGGNPDCPAKPPLTFEQCPPGLGAGEVCSYSIDCQSGSYSFDFTCSGNGWTLNQTACSFDYDSCPTTDIMCHSGQWGIWQGTNPPPPCPEAKPKPGDNTCYQGFGGFATCGYRCEGGSGWTIGSCYGIRSDGSGSWLYDGACAGDCSAKERPIIDYVQANRSCSVDSDCKIVYSDCAFTAQHCTGAFYVSTGVPMSKWNEFNAALGECAALPNSNWPCAVCDGIAPPPACVGGQCMPAQ